MAVYLGIDGGGTGCRAAVADAAGRRLGEASAGPANIVTDPEGARANILAAARMALGGHGALSDLHAVLGLAGANVPEYVARLARDLPFASVRIVNDSVIALKGAIGEADGVTATLGTGSVFAGQRGGEVRVIGGWGLLLGDEASGAWMGRALLSRALNARDGLVAMTPLLAAVTAEIGSAEAIVDFATTARPVDYGAFARRIVAAPEDPAAAAVLASADDWILRYLSALRGAEALPVTFLGGLGPVFEARLADRLAGAIRAGQGSALDGALAMARQGGGA